ncbi:RNA helicase [Saitoella coloradoensis]
MSFVCRSCLNHGLVVARTVRPVPSIATLPLTFSRGYARPPKAASARKSAAHSLSRNVGKSKLPTTGRGKAAASSAKGRPEAPRGKSVQAKDRRDNTADDKPKVKKGNAMTATASLQAFSIEERNHLDKVLAKDLGFESFRILPSVREAILEKALPDLEIHKPSPIQALAIPKILSLNFAKDLETARAYLIAAETGSGKTLAYLTPVIDYLKRQQEPYVSPAKLVKGADGMWEEVAREEPEEPKVDEAELRKLNHPRAVILVPSSELVRQVTQLVKTMSYKVKLSSLGIASETKDSVVRRSFGQYPIDILVATPARVQEYLKDGFISLDNTTHIVADEADTLFDTSFVDMVKPVLKAAKNLKGLVMCSATIPRALDSYLRKEYPECERIVTPKLHHVPRRIEFLMVDTTANHFNGRKDLALLDTLRTIAADGTEPGVKKRVLVFVNRREDALTTAKYLEKKELDARVITRDTQNRKDVLEQFLADEPRDENAKISEAMKVIVTTDLASRGVDTKNVRNVILYDVPRSSIELIHRVGRVGRFGRRGRAYMMVGKEPKYKLAWIREIRDTVRNGSGLV